MLKLYYAKGTAALAPHILLEDVGAQYETKLLSFADKDQTSSEYLTINPKGRVPTLETDRGLLTETPAILAYIAETHPSAGLLPEDPFDFAVAQGFNVFLASTLHVNHAHKLRGARWSDDPAAHESMRAKVPETMTECAALIEAHYLKGPWVMGKEYTICDPYLFVAARWLTADGVNIDDFPNIKAHMAAMLERASVQTVLPLHT